MKISKRVGLLLNVLFGCFPSVFSLLMFFICLIKGADPQFLSVVSFFCFLFWASGFCFASSLNDINALFCKKEDQDHA